MSERVIEWVPKSEAQTLEFARKVLRSPDNPIQEYFTGWIPYQRGGVSVFPRSKIVHDVQLENGDVHQCYMPNGTGWHRVFSTDPGPSRISDHEVTAIRLSKEYYQRTAKEKMDL